MRRCRPGRISRKLGFGDLEDGKTAIAVTSPFEELCSPDPFRELESRPVPKNDDRSGLYQRTFAQLSHGIRDRGIGVGRIQNDKIVGSAFAVEIALHRLAVDRALGRKLRAFQVFANDRRGRSSHFHKIDVGGAARKRLDAMAPVPA